MNVVSVIKWSLMPALCIALLGCDVVKLDADGRPIIPMSAEEAASLTNLTPEELADKFWSNVLQEADSAQLLSEIGTQQDNAAQQSQFIRIHGVINAIDDTKKAATMSVSTENNGEVTVQIGPIVRGNSIRDAASFIRFDDFKNQVQFARLSKELNKKAIQTITRPDASWVGNQVDILAAVTFKQSALADVIPLDITKR